MSNHRIYGMAFHSPLIIHSLIPPRDYVRALLLSDSVSEIKREIDLAVKASRNRPIVVLAGSLPILHVFLTESFPKIENPVKILLFDFPGLIIPFVMPGVKWIDCDLQSGGAWQITKLRPESFTELLTALPPIDKKVAETLLKATRYMPEERVPELERVAKHLPETYKSLITADDAKKTPKPQGKAKAKAVKKE